MLFETGRDRDFDAVIAPYHDVGMTAIKVASFGSAVNITLGLPFPRTSPDHGTALDIAGQDRADHGEHQQHADLRQALHRDQAEAGSAQSELPYEQARADAQQHHPPRRKAGTTQRQKQGAGRYAREQYRVDGQRTITRAHTE